LSESEIRVEAAPADGYHEDHEGTKITKTIQLENLRVLRFLVPFVVRVAAFRDYAGLMFAFS
jgi:hypothetical protein